MDSLSGSLLIAAPSLIDPNFQRTVVAIADHGDGGALGIVLNRRASVSVRESVPELAPVTDDDRPLFIGGPVHQDGIVMIAEFVDDDEGAIPMVGSIGLVGERSAIDRLTTQSGRWRAFAGHAGWAPGQLESELEREDWFVAPAYPQDVFADEPEALWAAVLDRMGGEYSLVARMPEDISVN